MLGRPFRFVELAQEINAGMPSYVRHRIQDALNDQGKSVKNAQILLLGVTYKPDIADQRESPVRPLARELLGMGATLEFHDPFVAKWNIDSDHGDHDGGRVLSSVTDITESLGKADIVILLQPHKSYNFDQIVGQSKLVLDTRGKLTGENVIRL